MGGGLFWRCDTKLEQFTLRIGTVFYRKLGEDQKEKKYSPELGSSFGTNSSFATNYQVQSQSSYILIANANGWAIFDFEAKIGRKSNKNRVFAYTACQWGANPTPLHSAVSVYATAFSCENRHSSSIALVSFFIDLRKKKGKIPLLAAKICPCKCSFRYILLKAVAKGKPARPRPF